MAGLGFALVLALPGAFGAFLWSRVLGVVSLPGILLGRGLGPRLEFPGWLLCAGCQLYAALAFTTLVLRATTRHLAGVTGPAKWIGWAVAFLVGSAPAMIAWLDWARDPPRVLAHRAAGVTAPLAALGFLLFRAHPELMRIGWDFVPTY